MLAYDLVIFIVGYMVGVAISYLLGKLVFSMFFKRQSKAITVESTVYYEAIQHTVSYALGFIMGGAFLDTRLCWVIFGGWMVFLSVLAVRIFRFDSIGHGATFAGVDTAGDVFVGALFGTSTAAFTLLRLTLAAI